MDLEKNEKELKDELFKSLQIENSLKTVKEELLRTKQ